VKTYGANAEQSTSGHSRVVDYYDRLAERYDDERFENSYGSYLDAQERRVVRRWLAPITHGSILDLACGTGRLLHMATYGLDASDAMVRIARQKHPDKQSTAAQRLTWPNLASSLMPFSACIYSCTCRALNHRPVPILP